MAGAEAALDKKGIVLRGSGRRFPGSPIRGTFFTPFAEPVPLEWVGAFNGELVRHNVVPKHEYKAAVDGIEFTCSEDLIPQYVESLSEYVDITTAAAGETTGERDRSSRRMIESLKRHL